jgi:hypothetical protein
MLRRLRKESHQCRAQRRSFLLRWTAQILTRGLFAYSKALYSLTLAPSSSQRPQSSSASRRTAGGGRTLRKAPRDLDKPRGLRPSRPAELVGRHKIKSREQTGFGSGPARFDRQALTLANSHRSPGRSSGPGSARLGLSQKGDPGEWLSL